MIALVPRLLDASCLQTVSGLIADATFEDGAATAGWNAKLVKKNEQAPAGQRRVDDAVRAVIEAIQTSKAVMAAVLPHRLSPPLVSRYRSGMAYGSHVDDAIRPGNPPMRADISYTVFLNAPGDYDGGDLVAATPAGERRIKLEAGSAVFYPSTTLHRVEQVTRGERVVMVGWMQSLVRDPAHREILFDLDNARRGVFDEAGKTQLFDTLSKTYSNLLRMWAEV